MNTAYVRGLGGICWADFFARVDARDAVAARLVDLPSRLPTMRDRLGMVELPGAEPGSRCETPFACEFLDRWAGLPTGSAIFHSQLWVLTPYRSLLQSLRRTLYRAQKRGWCCGLQIELLILE